MRQVKVRGRLIQQQNIGLLRKRHCNPHTLALTAGKLGYLAFGERHRIGGL